MAVTPTESTSSDIIQSNNKLKPYLALLKLRLTFLVIFSGLFGYLLATDELSWSVLIVLCIGSLCVTGSANIINQIYEKDLDKLMRRTQNRPLPMGLVSEMQAIIYATLLGLIGVYLLAFHVNFLTGGLSLLSLVLYSFLYTPLKQVSHLSVFVGAFPGALPPLIGWVAARGEITPEALIIFGIQFFWQFPHFWAIAWLGQADYLKAGFRMLPFGGEKDGRIPVMIATYTTMLIPMGILPSMYGITGTVSAVVAVLAGTAFLISTFDLIKTGSDASARKILWASFFYLPLVQVTYLIDRL